jgi:peptide-methionine (R)-S-oxide reductase
MTIKIINNQIVTDLYRKPTDKIQYLLPSSCHPSHIFKSIPYSLALRLVRICSTRELLDKRLNELKTMLITRKYNKNIINNAIEKAKKLDRSEILQKRTKKVNDRVILAITFNPKLPSVSKIIKKHWISMTKDPTMLKIFKKPPMLAFKQPPNLRSTLIHAKLPKLSKPKRKIIGIKPCNEPCGVCPYINHSKTFSSSVTKETFEMKDAYNCSTKSIIYLTSCTHCGKQYVGQSGRQLKDRMKEHLNNMYHKKEVTGTHYSLPGHSHWNFKVQIIEKVTPNTPNYRLEREDYWIKKLATKTPLGLNKND